MQRLAAAVRRLLQQCCIKFVCLVNIILTPGVNIICRPDTLAVFFEHLAAKPTSLFCRQEENGYRRLGHNATIVALLPSVSCFLRVRRKGGNGDTADVPCHLQYAEAGPPRSGGSVAISHTGPPPPALPPLLFGDLYSKFFTLNLE